MDHQQSDVSIEQTSYESSEEEVELEILFRKVQKACNVVYKIDEECKGLADDLNTIKELKILKYKKSTDASRKEKDRLLYKVKYEALKRCQQLCDEIGDYFLGRDDAEKEQ